MRCPDSSKPEVEMVINPKGIKVSDLKDQLRSKTRLPGNVRPFPFLYCDICGTENSANAGDYWNSNPDTVFTCCDIPMRLVRKVVQYIDVQVDEDTE